MAALNSTPTRWSARSGRCKNHLFADRNLQAQRRRTLCLNARRAHEHGQRTSDQPSRRTAAVGLEKRDSCQYLTDVQQTDAYGRSDDAKMSSVRFRASDSVGVGIRTGAGRQLKRVRFPSLRRTPNEARSCAGSVAFARPTSVQPVELRPIEFASKEFIDGGRKLGMLRDMAEERHRRPIFNVVGRAEDVVDRLSGEPRGQGGCIR